MKPAHVHPCLVFKAGAIYFMLVFGAGFLFGTVRVLLVAPRIGERLAALYESPLMLIVTLGAAWWVTRRFCKGFRALHLAAVGLIAIGVLLAAELVVGVALRGQSPAQVFTARDPLLALVYYGLLALFAAMLYRLSRLDTTSQFMYVPTARPAAVQNASASPHQYATPGRPISSQPLMSDASALIALTHGPKLLPPRKNFSVSAFARRAKNMPMPITAAMYTTITINICNKSTKFNSKVF